MKLTEVKTLKEEIHKKQLKEMFPTATNAQIDYALNEAPNFSGAVKTLKNLTTKAGQAAVNTGKKVIQKGAPIAKNLANKTKTLATQAGGKVKNVATQVGKDIGKGYKNVKAVGADAVKTAQKGMAQMRKDMDAGGGQQQPQQKDVDQQLRKGTNRLKSITGLKSPAIAAQALQRAANGEVLKPNERKEVAPILQALAQAMNSGTGVQRIISLIQQTKAKQVIKMRLDELKINEEQVARTVLKEKYPHLTEEQLDEIVQAILPALGAAGRVGLKLGSAALKTGGKLAYQGAKALGKGAVAGAKALGKGALNVGKDLAVSGAQAVANKMQGNANTTQQGNTTASAGGIQSDSPETKKLQQAKQKEIKAQMQVKDKEFQNTKKTYNQTRSELMKQLAMVMK